MMDQPSGPVANKQKTLPICGNLSAICELGIITIWYCSSITWRRVMPAIEDNKILATQQKSNQWTISDGPFSFVIYT